MHLWFTTSVLCFMICTVNFFYYGGAMYAFSQVLPDMELQLSPAMNLLIGAILELPGIFAAVVVGIYLSRKWTVLVALAGVLISTAVFAWAASHFAKVGGSRLELALQVSSFGFKGFSSMLFSIAYLYSIEVYPTTARVTGTGLCITTGRVGAIGGPVHPLRDRGERADVLPVMAATEKLVFANLGWGDSDISTLVKALPFCMSLKELDLR